MQADIIADEVLHIANNTEIGVIVTEKTTGIETRHADMIEHRRLKIDARKWYAGKIAPKKYGDKVSTELSGPDGGPVQVARIERVIVRPTEA